MTQTAHLHTAGDGGVIPFSNLGANNGWIEVTDTWSYASASTITVPTDATLKYRSGLPIRWKQGGAYKYGVIRTVAATLITLFSTTDYTVANSAITDISYSLSEKPFGFPIYFNFTFTSITYSGGTTDPTSNTVSVASWRVRGLDMFINMESVLVRGTGNRTIILYTLPFTLNSARVYIWNGMDTITAAPLIIQPKSCYVDPGNIINYIQTMANNGSIWFSGSAPIL